jgi:hypothetical protein
MALLAAAGCDFPRDQSGTFERIEASRTIRVGLTQIDAADAAAAQGLIHRLEAATGAKAVITGGPAERQLSSLEHGDLDLVIGEFADDTPWLDAVAVMEPIRTRAAGERTLGLAPVAANGENRWIAMVERTVRDGRSGQ